jgi:hypothetical protein
MSFAFNFGRFQPGAAPRRLPTDEEACFRIVLMGDFSGRGARGRHRSREALAEAKLKRLDPDTLEPLITSFGGTLSLTLDSGDRLAVPVANLDDLHPDALFDRLPLFDELSSLRQRLDNPKTSGAAAAEVRQWPAAAAVAPAAPPPRGDALDVQAELADFARLLGLEPSTPAAPPPPSPIEALIRHAVAPYMQQALAPDAQALTGVVDQALSATMRAVLHHPAFQALESAWRSLDLLARRAETDATLQVLVLDISAEEFAADLSAGDDLQDSALYQLLVEQPALKEQPLSALVGQFEFERTAGHAELLGRIGALAERAGAPFIGAVNAGVIGAEAAVPDERAAAAWAALRELPAARYLALTAPRWLLRAPYGRRSQTIERFDFEELAASSEAVRLPWAPAPVLAAVLLAAHVRDNGPDEAPGALLSVDDMPGYVEYDSDGDAVGVRCTEQVLPERLVAQCLAAGWIPVLGHKGRYEVRLGGFQSLAGGALAGRWSA